MIINQLVEAEVTLRWWRATGLAVVREREAVAEDDGLWRLSYGLGYLCRGEWSALRRLRGGRRQEPLAKGNGGVGLSRLSPFFHLHIYFRGLKGENYLDLSSFCLLLKQ
ncbi:hypothetical protein CASFOL_030383 [Castilleja foliolosa]|uniref:Uncharacterized protein n=1 Tax=Castilleja foliolosa TaxID=1961234 RepID=A0ABD3C980_9LAMI